MKKSIIAMLGILCFFLVMENKLSVSVANANEPANVVIKEVTIKGFFTSKGVIGPLTIGSTTDAKLKSPKIEQYDFMIHPDNSGASLEIETLYLTYDDKTFYRGGSFQFKKVKNVLKSVSENVLFGGVSGGMITISKLNIELTGK